MPTGRALTALQREVLEVLVAEDDGARLHGFALAERLQGGSRARALIGHGTLYRVLGRLLELELVTAVWEDPAVAETAGRPRRRLFAVTAAGAAALRAAPAAVPGAARTAGGLA